MQGRTFCYFVLVFITFSLGAVPPGLMLNPVKDPARLSFSDTLRLALERNDELKRVDAQIRIADGEVLGATSKLLPKVNSKLVYETPTRVPDAQGDGEASIGISANIPLLDTKSLVDVKAKRESRSAARDRLLHQRDTLIYEVGSLYVEAAIAQALTENALEEREVYQKQVAIFERKSQVGHARNLDIRRAHYLAAKAYSEYLLKRQDALKKIGALGRKIGVNDYFLLSDMNISSPHLAKSADDLFELAKSSAEIAVLTKELSAASYSVMSESFDFFPKLSASFEGGWQTTTSLHRLIEPAPRFQARGMLMLELPIFSGGATYAGIKTTSARKAIAELNLRTKTMEKHLSINSALTELKDFEVVITNAQLALDAAILAKESAQRMFDSNEATGLELVEANTNHFSAKNLMANSRYGHERAKLQLLYAVGTISEVLPQ